jgi:hypothetical protein
MVQLSISTNFPDVMRQMDRLQENIGAKALARAVNSTMAQAKTSMSREIRSEFNISASKVSAALRVNKASYKNGRYVIEASLESPTKRGRSINVINFSARQTSRGVSVLIKKGGGRKVLPHAFIGNNGRTVFERVGKARLPIKAVQTLDVAQMFNTKRINARVVKFMEDKFPEVFEREVKFAIDQFNRGSA